MPLISLLFLILKYPEWLNMHVSKGQKYIQNIFFQILRLYFVMPYEAFNFHV